MNGKEKQLLYLSQSGRATTKESKLESYRNYQDSSRDWLLVCRADTSGNAWKRMRDDDFPVFIFMSCLLMAGLNVINSTRCLACGC